MPYIEKSERKFFDNSGNPIHPGELNYVITKLCHKYIKAHGLSYSILNEVIGVLECAKQELYRMIAAKYEDKKRMENGAISELDAIQPHEVR